MTTDAKSVTLRPVREEDEPFLFEVYSSTRMAELALLNWPPEQRDAFLRMQFTAQRNHYASYYPEGEHSIILANDQAVGRLYVARQQEQIHILDITVLPQYGNAGVGTAILKELLEEAAQTGRSVFIYVENFNRSLRLFERLGFVKSEESGFNYLMKWSPHR